MMTVKINSFCATRTSPIDLGKPKLAKGVLVAPSFFQEEKTSTCCQRLVDGIKRIFEKFVSILCRVFCCKYSDKKESSIEPIKQKSLTSDASTTGLKPVIKKKPETSTASLVAQTASKTEGTKTTQGASSLGQDSYNESFGDFTRVHQSVKGLIGEYLTYPDSLRFAKCYPDFSEQMYKNFLKELEGIEVLSLYMLPSLFTKLKEFSEVLSEPIELNSGCEIVLKYCKNLKVIIFGRPFDIELLKGICRYMPPSVTTLNFKITNISDSELRIFSEKYSQLREINLRDSKLISADELIALAQNCKQLERLDLSCCDKVRDAVLTALGQNCKKLQEISIDGCLQVTNAGITALATNCKELQRVNFVACKQVTDADLQVLATNCKQLKEIDLWWCDQITDAGVQSLAENCKQLKRLHVTCCVNITDVGLRAIAEHCKQLQDLCLSACFRITDAGLRSIAENCRQLRDLNIAGCPQLTDAALTALATHCNHLQRLVLEHNRHVTDVGLTTLATHCKQLQYLNLVGCANMTDIGLAAIATNCKQLRTLELSSTNITDNGLKILGEHCSQLEVLYLIHCSSITDAGLQLIKTLLPHLQIFKWG